MTLFRQMKSFGHYVCLSVIYFNVCVIWKTWQRNWSEVIVLKIYLKLYVIMAVIVAGHGWHNGRECSDEELWPGDTSACWSSLASAQCQNKTADCWSENTARNAAVRILSVTLMALWLRYHNSQGNNITASIGSTRGDWVTWCCHWEWAEPTRCAALWLVSLLQHRRKLGRQS